MSIDRRKFGPVKGEITCASMNIVEEIKKDGKIATRLAAHNGKEQYGNKDRVPKELNEVEIKASGEMNDYLKQKLKQKAENKDNEK